ncbi:hypothetical protein D3C76_1009060 [compost metagenome]
MFDGLDVGRGHAVDQVQVTAFEHQAQRLRLGHVAHQHPLHFCRASPVTIETSHHQRIVGAPFAQGERAAAGFVGDQPGGAQIAILLMLQGLLTIDHHGAGGNRQRVEHQQRVDRLWQIDHQGLRIGGADQPLDVVDAVAVGLPGGGQAEVEFHHAVQRPGHVFGGQRVAGMELDVAAQVEGDLLAVFADLPAFGQLWQVFFRVALVALDQRVIQVGVDPGGIQARGVGRVDGKQVDHAHADDQLVGGGLGLHGGHRPQCQHRTQQAQAQDRKYSFHVAVLVFIVMHCVRAGRAGLNGSLGRTPCTGRR